MLPRAPEVNSSSMADIAFLLLTFFLLTATIVEQKGILMILPEYQNRPPVTEQNDRNVFTIQINSQDHFLVEGNELQEIDGLHNEIMKFIMNNGVSPTMAETPEKAIVSIKTDRGTSHGAFIAILDQAQAAYFEIYANRAGITSKEFRNLDVSDPVQRRIYNTAREGVPMNISIAEPTSIK
jgi:biopolymer transport protein ExbD